MGADAIAKKKSLHANPLPILGIAVEVNLAGVTFVPEPEKLKKWRKQIEDALQAKELPGGEASKLAGEYIYLCGHDVIHWTVVQSGRPTRIHITICVSTDRQGHVNADL